MKAIANIATSVDGYISRPDGRIDWLQASGSGAAQHYDFASLLRGIDALVIGRRTYDQALSFGRWPYGDKRVVVLSHGYVHVPGALARTVEFSPQSPGAVLQRLAWDGMARVAVNGGATIRSFLRDHLLAELTITRVPILLGAGVPLFEGLDAEVQLELLSVEALDDGLVQTRYRIARVARPPEPQPSTAARRGAAAGRKRWPL